MLRIHTSVTSALVRTFLLALVWLLVIRALLVLQSGVIPSLPGTLGGDIAGAILLTLFLQVCRGMFRALFVVVLGCALYVAGMHLTAHGTLFQLAFASKGVDSTFITGSLLNLYLLTLPVYLLLAWVLHWLHRRWALTTPGAGLPLAALSTGVVAVYMLLFPSLTTPANNVVASTLAQIPRTLLNPVGVAIGNQAAEMNPQLEGRTNFFQQKVSGRTTQTPPNVLLIMIEGLSGGYLPSVSNYHNLAPVVSLDNLETTFNDLGFRIYRNVLSMERQTDRGTFTLVCGRYPDLRRASEKVVSVADQEVTPDCLPEKLREQGYHTAYWQAAPINYMKKDKFMPRAGYTDTTGAEAFASEGEVDGWGPADPVFFDNIASRLRQLDKQDKPWFVTTLNVGTHHPFDTGKATSPALGESDDALPVPSPQAERQQAMKVMADTLGHFLNRLDKEGILDNTLVLVTSDESGGFIREDHESLPLNSNIGMLAIRPPNTDNLDHYAPDTALVAQLDVPISILDAAGYGASAGGMIGTSLLALDQNQSRDIMLADTYTGMKYFLRNGGNLMACTELMTRCSSWSFDPQRLFGSLTETQQAPFLTLEERLALVENATRINVPEN